MFLTLLQTKCLIIIINVNLKVSDNEKDFLYAATIFRDYSHCRESMDASESGKTMEEAFSEGFAPEPKSKLHFEDVAGNYFARISKFPPLPGICGIELLQLMQMTSKQKFFDNVHVRLNIHSGKNEIPGQKISNARIV